MESVVGSGGADAGGEGLDKNGTLRFVQGSRWTRTVLCDLLLG